MALHPMSSTPPKPPASAARLNVASLRALPKPQRLAFLKTLTARELRVLAMAVRHDWDAWARPDQKPPAGDWRVWVFLGGRGAGKTRAGAEWVRSQMEGDTPLAAGAVGQAALIGATLHDAREVMVEGVSGLRAVAPLDHRPHYETSRRRLIWPNGAVAHVFSAEEPDRLRGPQFAAAWADEFAAWSAPDEALAMLELGLRLGAAPRLAVTTTPKPLPALKALLARPDTVRTHAPTRANAANLAPSFLASVETVYGGGRLGRQELDGELIEDVEGALWTRDALEAAYDASPPPLERIVLGVDPPAEAGPRADACGLVVAGAVGEGRARRAWVLADRTVQGLSPAAWAQEAATIARAWEADRVVAEVNQGGALVSELLAFADPSLPVRAVRASRSKRARAEPIAALYEQGRVRHAGRFRALEDQMCAFTGASDGRSGGSPDRVDALVWALWALLIDPPDAPRLRRV